MLPNDYRAVVSADWLEYSGGSRRGARRMRFRSEEGLVWLDLSYRFDFTDDEEAVQEFSFPMPEEEFRKAWRALVTRGRGYIQHRSGDFSVELWLEQTAYGFRFKLSGSQPMPPFVGASNIVFDTFVDVLFPPGAIAPILAN